MGNIITIPKGEPRSGLAERGSGPRVMVACEIDSRTAQDPAVPVATKPERTSLRRNVTTDKPEEPVPSVRDIMRENAQLRADNKIMALRLKRYAELHGELA